MNDPAPDVVDAQVVPDADQPQPAEPSPGTAIATREASQLIPASSPVEMISKATAVADALKSVVDRQGLTTKIGDKDHIQVEAWQTLGTLLGVSTDLVWARRLPEPTEYDVTIHHYKGRPKRADIKSGKAEIERTETRHITGWDYEARVECRLPDGTLVGSGESLCSRKEKRWADADDFAVKSMAITRATSRALKGAAGWVAVLAGYSATPAEEMQGTHGGTDDAAAAAGEHLAVVKGDDSKKAQAALTFLLNAGETDEVEAWVPEAAPKLWEAFGAPIDRKNPPVIVAAAIRAIARTMMEARKPAEEPKDGEPAEGSKADADIPFE